MNSIQKRCVRYGTSRVTPPVLPLPDSPVRSVGHQFYFGNFGTTSIPVAEPSATSVGHGYRYRRYRYRLSYRYRTLRSLRCDLNTSTGYFGNFGTTWVPVPPVPVQTFIPVPETSVTSVRHQYRYRTLRYVRYDINTGAGHFGNFGTTSIPVPNS